MRNIRLTIAYDGTDYVGWQVQPNGPSVQTTVESAIAKLTGETTRLQAAGRTDSGVHALGQVANFSSRCAIPCANIRAGLQTFLPDDIVVRDVEDVSSDFHATYSATKKRYRYVIFNSGVPDPFVRRYAWRVPADLDSEAMHDAAQHLVGTHDFRCFESHFPNRATSVRTVSEAVVGRHAGWPVWNQPDSLNEKPCAEGQFIWFEIVADGFLYNMVRAIMGTLIKVGRNVWQPEAVHDIIQGGDRAAAGETAPACGLYLVDVSYENGGLLSSNLEESLSPDPDCRT